MQKHEVNIVTKKSSATLSDDYDKAEIDLLKQALKRTHLERLLFATRLYKIQKTLKKAQITHQPFISK